MLTVVERGRPSRRRVEAGSSVGIEVGSSVGITSLVVVRIRPIRRRVEAGSSVINRLVVGSTVASVTSAFSDG